MKTGSHGGELAADRPEVWTSTAAAVGAGALRADVRIIVLAAMARDCSIKSVEVRLSSRLPCATDIAEIAIYGADLSVRTALGATIGAAIRRCGWRVVARDNHPLWSWTLLLVDRTTISAHELANATRRVKT